MTRAGVLSLRVEGGGQVTARLRDLAQRGRDPSPVWPVLADRWIVTFVGRLTLENEAMRQALAAQEDPAPAQNPRHNAG